MLREADDHAAFERLAERHRGELQLHCYRMMGSLHDAEDLVQETLLRAWRGLDGFERRASIRSWLYRIATNACLNALAARKRSRRVLPDTEAPPRDDMPGAEPAADVDWIEPYPDVSLTSVPDTEPDPAARCEMRELVNLAFVAALQHLPPRQRAVLLLRDALGWSATEAARLLDTSVAAVNGALQRARAALDQRLPDGSLTAPAPLTAQQRSLLDRYMTSWERADVDGFVALIRDDAVFTMPPWREWYSGRRRIGELFAWTARRGGRGPFRLIATAANRQPAFAFYSRWQSSEWRAHSIQLLRFDGELISAMTSFVTPSLFAPFRLPATLPPDPAS